MHKKILAKIYATVSKKAPSKTFENVKTSVRKSFHFFFTTFCLGISWWMKQLSKLFQKVGSLLKLSSTRAFLIYTFLSFISFPLTASIFFQTTLYSLPFSYFLFLTISFSLLSLATLLLTKDVETFSLTFGSSVLGESLALSSLTVFIFSSVSVSLASMIPLLPLGFYLLLWAVYLFLLCSSLIWKSFAAHKPLWFNFYEKNKPKPNHNTILSFQEKQTVLVIGDPRSIINKGLFCPTSVIGYLKTPTMSHHPRAFSCLGHVNHLEAFLKAFYKKNIPLAKIIISQSNTEKNHVRDVARVAKAYGLDVFQTKELPEKESLTLEHIKLSEFVEIKDASQATWDYGNFFTDKRILVTGAGTSVGIHLVHKLASFRPKHIHLMDTSPQALALLQNDLLETNPSLSINATLDCVPDFDRLETILNETKADQIFHLGLHGIMSLLESDLPAVLDYAVTGTHNLCTIASQQATRAMTFLSLESLCSSSWDQHTIFNFCEQYVQHKDIFHQLKSHPSRFLVMRSDCLLDEIEVFPALFLKSALPTDSRISSRSVGSFYSTSDTTSSCLLRLTDFGSRPSQGPGNLFLCRPSDQVPFAQLLEDLASITSYKAPPTQQLRIIEGNADDAPNPPLNMSQTPYPGLYKVGSRLIPMSQIDKLVAKLQSLMNHRSDSEAIKYLSTTMKNYTNQT